MDDLRPQPASSRSLVTSQTLSICIDSFENFEQSTSAGPSPLPGALANAVVLAYEGLPSLALTESARRVLACLIRYGLKLSDLRQPAFIKKSTIADKLGINQATVYRALDVLESAGLIVRNAQASLRSISTIVFTPFGLSVLGLTRVKAPDRNRLDEKQPTRIAPVRDVNSEPKQSCSKRQRDEFDEQRKSPTLPTDLRWLVEKRLLTPFGVCALMRVARERGHRLSDVVSHASKQLGSPNITNAFAYLRALLQGPTDYAYLAKQREEKARQASVVAERGRAREELEERLNAHVGSTFESSDGALWTVEEGVLVRENLEGVKASTPIGHASDIVAAIVGGMMRRVPSDLTVRRQSTESARGPVAGAHARSLLATLRESLKVRTLCR